MPVRDDRKNKDLHLEEKHVYNVYDQIATKFSEISQKAWPNVRRFLKELPPGSIVADIGCGSGRYLHINSRVFKLGLDICSPLVEGAKNKGHEVLVADNLTLPFRDGVFDAVISIGVIHHFSSQSRRLQAVKEMCRLLRSGGRIMIYVWAFEQKHRKFRSQDVLIPWHTSHSSTRLDSIDGGVSSNASSDSESSIDIDDSRRSKRNFNRTLSDPGTEQEDTHIQSYLRNVTQEPHLLSQKHRCNTLPSSLEGLSGEESHDDVIPNVLADECRKFEASLKAMSSSMFYLSEKEHRQTMGNGQVELGNRQKNHQMAAENPTFSQIRNQSTSEILSSGTSKATSMANHSNLFESSHGNGNKEEQFQHEKEFIADRKDLCNTMHSSVLQKGVDNSSRSDRNCDICPGHTSNLGQCPYTSEHDKDPDLDQYPYTSEHDKDPDLGQYPSSQYPSTSKHDKDPDIISQTKSKDSGKTKKNKLTIFASIKESFLNFFEGKSSKMIKPKLEISQCETEEIDVSDFAVREFPMSSCPNYRKENFSEVLNEVFESREIQHAKQHCASENCNGESEVNPQKDTCLEAITCDSRETLSQISGPTVTLLKHSLSDISKSKCLKHFDDISSDSFKIRSQMSSLSQQHSHSLPVVSHITDPVHVDYPPASVPSSPAVRIESFKKSTELSRFYHVFKDGELSKLISKHIPNVRIIHSTYDHANWCIVAEKCY